MTICHNHDLCSPVQRGGQGVEWGGGGDKVEQSLNTVVGGGLGHNIVLRHCLVNLRAPGIQVLNEENNGKYIFSPPVVDGDEDGVGGSGGGQQGPGVGDVLRPRLLRPLGSS